MRSELLPDGHRWLRVADPAWADPLDPAYAGRAGGRWNPPDSFPVLYLNEDVVTARINLQLFLGAMPYGPEDLRDDNGPIAVEAVLPRRQRVADVHTPAGVRAAGLPPGYPLDRRRRPVSHRTCQRVGATAYAAGLRGVRARSAQAVYGAGRELAWFPATPRSRARAVAVHRFEAWFWA